MHQARAVFVLALAMFAIAAAPPAFAQTEDDVVINEFTVNPTAGKEYVELLVTKAGGVDLQGWTLSDVGTRAGAAGTTEGDFTLPASAPYLASVPQGTFVVIVLTVPSANVNTLAEDTSTGDGNRRLVLLTTTTGVVTAGTLDLSTNENLQLYAGARSTGTLIDQALTGNNTSYIAGATWGDDNGATTADNINAGSATPSNAAVRFVPTADTVAEFQNNDTGSRYVVDSSSYGTPGDRNTGVASDTSLGGTATTNPSGTGDADPASVLPGESTLLTVDVTPGTEPASTGIQVRGDLSSIGGSATQPFFDDGTNGDATAGDNVFSYLATVPPTTGPGSKTLPATITDAQSRSGSASISLLVIEVIPIGVVQGPVSDTADVASHRSPFAPPLAPTASNPCAPNTAGSQTVTVQGVIYQKTLARTATGGLQHGFHIQNTAETDDDDPLSSDGVFVFMGSFTTLIGGYAPQVGDEVVISARVTEFFCLTELTSASLVRLVREGVVLDLEVPAFVVDPPDSSVDAGRYWERREGMRARVPAGSVVVDSRDVFPDTFDAEVWLARADEPISLRADPFARRVFRDPHPLDNRPELFDDGNGYRFMLASLGVKATASGTSDEKSRVLLAPARTYDTLTNSPVGGVYFSFNKYGIQVEQQPALIPGPDPSTNSPPTAPQRPQEYSMADYNVENLYDYRDDPFDGCDFVGNPGCPGVSPPFNYVPGSAASYEAHVAEIAQQIVSDLHAPEILLLQEAEDQDICTVSGTSLACGTTNNADGKPDTLQEVALAIAARGGPQYDAAYDRDGADDRGIVSGFLYRTDRVQLLPAPAGDPVLGSSPTVSYRSAPLAYNTQVQNPKVLNAVRPADVDTSTGVDGPNVFTRPPQVGLFRIWELPGRTGNSFDLYAISNHFSSTPDARVGQRREQAAYNAAIAAAIQAARPGMRIAIGGDLNVYPRPDDPFPAGHPRHPSDQLGPLYAQGLVNLWDVLVAEAPVSAYSYIFQGQTQTLDQHFVSPSLRSELRQFRMAHVNADWPADHPGDGARGASDHDPGVARFAAPEALAGMAVTKAASTDQTVQGSVISYTITARNAGPSTATNVTLTDEIPAGVTFLGAQASQGSCSGTTTITCNIGTLASGASARVVIDVRADQTGTITNTASTRAAQADPSESDNRASATTTIVAAPLAPPPQCRLSVTPKKLFAGRRGVVRVLVEDLAARRPLADRRVRLRGLGIDRSARTGGSGTVRFGVRPRRAGILRVTVPEFPGCGARITVRQRVRTGISPGLTGRIP